jgi:SAM-dependent methyltransferase
MQVKNKESWKPSKFVYRNGRLSASRDPREVNPSSRLMAGAIAAMYEQHLPTHARGRLIDLGCGDVPLFGAYAAYVADVVCVDWGNTAHKNQYLDYECDLSQPLPFADAEFDTLILSDVLEHIATPDSLWGEIARILKPNGIAFVNTPFYYWLHEEPHDYHRYTCFALQRLAERAGFEVILLKALGGSPEVFADLLAKHFIRIPLAGRACAVALQEATRLFVRTKIGRRMSEYSAAKFPFGYFMLARKLG